MKLWRDHKQVREGYRGPRLELSKEESQRLAEIAAEPSGPEAAQALVKKAKERLRKLRADLLTPAR